MAGVAETGLGLKRGYVTGAILLLDIIKDAKKLENDLVFISRIEKNEVNEKRVEVLEKDEKRVTKIINDAVDMSEKLMVNCLEMLRRFAAVQLWELRYSKRDILSAMTKGTIGDRWVMPYVGKQKDAIKRTVKILDDTANRAIGIKGSLLNGLLALK